MVVMTILSAVALVGVVAGHVYVLYQTRGSLRKRRKKHRLQSSLLRYITTKT